MSPTERSSSPGEAIVRTLLDPTRRIVVLGAAAYAFGIAGIVASFAGDASAGATATGATGIALLGCSFVCLFVASTTAIRTGPAGPRR